MISSWLLLSAWKLASIVHNVYDAYEEYYAYLTEMDFEQYDESKLRRGDWVSRSMEGGFSNTGVLIYTQHHGVVIDVNPVKIVHFQDNKIKESTLEQYMNGEKILNVYKNNPLVTYTKEWEGHYNLVTRNCEHFASLLVEGVARSRQIEVLEHLAWGALWKAPSQEVMESLKLIPRLRFYV